MTSPLFSCPSLSGVLPHLLFLQNLPSVVAGHVLDPQPSEMILDMCAAPGEIIKTKMELPAVFYFVISSNQSRKPLLLSKAEKHQRHFAIKIAHGK